MSAGARKIRVAIVDDEPVARRILLRLMAGEPDVEVVGDAGNGEDAIALLTHEEVDVAFLDVQMPEMNGFELLAKLPNDLLPVVVFVTAHDEYAVRAFEVGAVDYLLKPFDDARFRSTFTRVRRQVQGGDDAAKRAVQRLARQLLRGDRSDEHGSQGELLVAGARTRGRIAVRSGKRIEFVEVGDIEWVEADNYYVRIHTRDRSYLMRESLTRLHERLDPDDFVRVHRSAVVRTSLVRELRLGDHGRYEAVLANGERIQVSRSRRAQVLRALGVDPDG